MIFVTVQEVIDGHAEIIREYGGLDGIRDLGLLISAIEMPKSTMFGTFLHPTIFDKAAAYLFHLICNHPFLDGNKRTATITSLSFLIQNEIHIKFTKKQSFDLEELVVDTARNKVTKSEISQFFEQCYDGSKVVEKSKPSKKLAVRFKKS